MLYDVIRKSHYYMCMSLNNGGYGYLVEVKLRQKI